MMDGDPRRARPRNYEVQTHGHCRHRREDMSLTYKSWQNMRGRCNNANRPDYAHVSVCDRWGSFEAFLEDMGPRPSEEHSIDRLDHAGDYEPGNCRWATDEEQRRNKSNNRWLTHPDTGETLCLVDWAKRLGIRPSTLHWRAARWPLRRALTPGDQREARHRTGTL